MVLNAFNIDGREIYIGEKICTGFTGSWQKKCPVAVHHTTKWSESFGDEASLSVQSVAERLAWAARDR